MKLANCQRQPAFSLIEMITSLAIAAMLLSLGIAGLFSLRDRTTTKLAVDEFIQNFNSVKNAARNSVVSVAGGNEEAVINNVNNLDYYALIFEGTGMYARFRCQVNAGTNVINCPANTRIPLRTGNYSTINFTSPVSTCSAILFSLSTGSITFGSFNNNNITVNATQRCNYDVRFAPNSLVNFRLTADTATDAVTIS